MPLFNLLVMEGEGGEVVDYGSMSYLNGDSLDALRKQLNALNMFEAGFAFWDADRQRRIPRMMERGNKVEDYIIGVTVLVEQQMNELAEQSSPKSVEVVKRLEVDDVECEIVGVASSNASNEPDTSSIFLNAENKNASNCGQEDFSSILMPEDLQELWRKQYRKLIVFMVDHELQEHRWKVKTWDDGEVFHGKIECLECGENRSGATSKGLMDKNSVNNVFVNFKAKHMETPKHKTNFLRKRKLAVDSALNNHAVKKSKTSKELVNAGVDIVSRINEQEMTQEGRVQKPFYIVGDLQREPCVISFYRVECTYCCGVKMQLVPDHRNLEWNLEQHLASSKHIAGVVSLAKGGSKSLLSGKAGRPLASDKRDTKQRSMENFYSPHSGMNVTGGSSSYQPGTLTVSLSLSLLCWGLWKSHVLVSGVSRPVKCLLDDQQGGGKWCCEPHTKAVVFNKSSEQEEVIEGTFRHSDCSRISQLGGGFEDLTCWFCHIIPMQTDFRLRTLREMKATEKRGSRDSRVGRRLDHLTSSELRVQARGYSSLLKSNVKLISQFRMRLCKLQAKVPNLREMVGEASNRKDVYKFCSTIVSAHRNNTFGGRTALWDLLKDIVLNLNRSNAGKRYSAGTKTIMQALFQHGGRRVIECLSMNMLSPSVNTLQRDRRGLVTFQTGIHDKQFQLIASVLKKAKERAGIIGDIPVLLAEDETTVKKSVRWLAKTDVLIGFCGTIEDHQCQSGFEVKVGNGEAGFDVIMKAFEQNVMGGQARVIMVNPLVAEFPRLCLLASPTCNHFKSPFVRDQWQQLMCMWNVHCRQHVGPVIGHSSDGDVRRRKLMLQDYVGKGEVLPRKYIGWEGWSLSGSVLSNGDIYGLHDQDFIHNAKKLVNPLDSPVRILHAGAYIITLEHLEIVYRTYSLEEHGLMKDDLSRTDRQNWSSAQRLCNRKVLVCLDNLGTRDDARVEMTLGTRIYLQICGDYIDIFLNARLSLRQRIVHSARVSFFFRLWRLWLCVHKSHEVGGNTQALTLGNMISTQSFYDLQMSCHFVVHLICLFRDRYPYIPVPLHLTGSDSCEQFFSKVGGMKGHERNYDFAELIDAATGLNRLAELGMSEGVISVGKSHKKYKNIWMKLHPLLPGESVGVLNDYEEIITTDLVIEALKQGFAEAQELCISLEMCPSTSARRVHWWFRPWLVEAEFTFADFVALKEVNIDELTEEEIEDVPHVALIDDCDERVDLEPNMNDSMDDGNAENDLDDGADDVAVASSELRHVMNELIDEEDDAFHAGNEFGHEQRKISPYCSFEGRTIYKSTLVSQLVGNPILSKDRLRRVKQSFYFNNHVDQVTLTAGSQSMWVGIGDDRGVSFLVDMPVPLTRTKSKGKGKKGQNSSTRPHNQIRKWYVGRIQKIRKKYIGKKWSRVRDAIDLLNLPVAKADQRGVICEVLFNYFKQIGNTSNFKYVIVDPQWIDVSAIATRVTMTVDPQKPKIFSLDAGDMATLEELRAN